MNFKDRKKSWRRKLKKQTRVLRKMLQRSELIRTDISVVFFCVLAVLGSQGLAFCQALLLNYTKWLFCRFLLHESSIALALIYFIIILFFLKEKQFVQESFTESWLEKGIRLYH